MVREYHVWNSPAFGREMELLLFGTTGIPVVCFPTACGRFYDWENNGMIHAIQSKIDSGEIKLFCIDSVDSESWYAQEKPGEERIAKHIQFEQYILKELLPFVRKHSNSPQLAVAGCGFGAFHATSLALRHADQFPALLSLGGHLDAVNLLDGFCDEDCYFHLPLQFLPNLSDPKCLDRYRRSSLIFAVGENDPHRRESEEMVGLLRRKQIPVRLDIWQDGATNDWYWWQKMLAASV